MRQRKRYTVLFILGLMAVLGTLYTRTTTYRQALQESVAEKVIRFHVVANSDNEEDQRIKLKVRDQVGMYLAPYMSQADSKEESREILVSQLSKIQQVAQRTLDQEGSEQTVQVALRQTDFPDKKYGPYTLAAGNYEALEITLGAGQGKNWWCVMYPDICFKYTIEPENRTQASDQIKKAEIGEDQNLKKILTSEEYESIMDSSNYEIHFKLLDLLKEYFHQKSK